MASKARKKEFVKYISKLSSDRYNIALVLLAVLAILLAYLIYDKYAIGEGEFIEERVLQNDELNTNQDYQQQAAAVPLPEDLTENERMLFEIAANNVPEDSSDKFNELIDTMKTESSTLDIGNCQKPFPLVMEVVENSEFLLVNSDNETHTFSIDAEDTYEVAPDASVTVVADFYNGPSVYGYACDSSGRASGFISIVPSVSR